MAEEKKLYNPIIFDEPDDPEIKQFATSKSFEDRLYVFLFTDANGLHRYEQVIGRTKAFKALQELLSMEMILAEEIQVLVELPVKDKSNNFRWVLMSPQDENCKNALEFYMSIRNQFPESEDFDIWDYTNYSESDFKPEDQKDEEAMAIPQGVIRSDLFSGDAGLANLYQKEMEAKEKVDLFPSSSKPGLFYPTDEEE